MVLLPMLIIYYALFGIAEKLFHNKS